TREHAVGCGGHLAAAAQARVRARAGSPASRLVRHRRRCIPEPSHRGHLRRHRHLLGTQDPKQEWGSLWAMWWAGDALGVLLLAPVLLCLIGRREVPLALRPMNLALVALQLLVGGYVFALHS